MGTLVKIVDDANKAYIDLNKFYFLGSDDIEEINKSNDPKQTLTDYLISECEGSVLSAIVMTKLATFITERLQFPLRLVHDTSDEYYDIKSSYAFKGDRFDPFITGPLK